jgi:aminomethyltransferase
MTGDATRHLPLEDLHQTAGAKFGPFAGWSMPLTYPAGVMKEHLHAREHVGVFDISHMKLFEIEGPGAVALLDRACPLDAGALSPSQSKYTLLLNEQAGVIDDLIVTRLGEKRFMVVANAGNAAADEAHLRAIAKEFDARVNPLNRIFLAIQGPQASAALSRVGIETASLVFMHGIEPKPDWFLTRSGYTGEDGFEIGLPEEDARKLLTKLFEDDLVQWIGLAARDSLRLEAGLCLHGQDITPDTNPVDAGLMWAVPKEIRTSGSFIGAGALREAIAQGAIRKRVGLKPEGRQPVRAGTPLSDADGNGVGTVTSGGVGPSVGHPVAMGYVASALATPGTKLFADVRGTKIPVDIHPLPFTPHRYRKG